MLHLTEIGIVSLLDTDGEVRLAAQLERGTLRMRKLLSGKGCAVCALVNRLELLGDEVREARSRLDRVGPLSLSEGRLCTRRFRGETAKRGDHGARMGIRSWDIPPDSALAMPSSSG